MTILLAYVYRSSIIVSSLRGFPDMDALAQFIKEHPRGIPENSLSDRKVPWDYWMAYKVFDDGSDGQPLSLKEKQAVGMRSSKKKKV